MPGLNGEVDLTRLARELEHIVSQSTAMAQFLIEEQTPDAPPAANDQPIEVQRRNRSITLSHKLSKSLRGLASHARSRKRRSAHSGPNAPNKRRATTLVGVVPHPASTTR